MRKKVFLMMMGVIFCVGIQARAQSFNTIDNSQTISNLKNLIRYTQHWNEECSDETIQISYEDAQRLMKIAFAEAGSQGIEGQLRVMQVVWNRVQSPEYPDTIEKVISQPFQFETFTNGMYEDAEPNTDSHLALAQFESNRDHDNRILAFETTSNGRALEEYFSFLFTLKDHDFYTKK